MSLSSSTRASSLRALKHIDESLPTSGSLVFDIGTRLTKVGVVGETAVRYVFLTPKSVGRSMQTARDPSVIVQDCEELLLAIAARIPASAPDSVFVILENSGCNPDFSKALLRCLPRACGCDVAAQTMNAQHAALFAAGERSGCVIDVGFSSTRCVPVVRDLLDSYDAKHSRICWRAVLDNLRKQVIRDNGATLDALPQYRSSNPSASLLSDELLESYAIQHGFVAPPPSSPDYEKVLNAVYPLVVDYPTPDGQRSVALTAKPALALELLFSGGDEGYVPLPLLFLECVASLEMPLRPLAASFVLLCGSAADVLNMKTRFAAELLSWAANATAPKNSRSLHDNIHDDGLRSGLSVLVRTQTLLPHCAVVPAGAIPVHTLPEGEVTSTCVSHRELKTVTSWGEWSCRAPDGAPQEASPAASDAVAAEQQKARQRLPSVLLPTMGAMTAIFAASKARRAAASRVLS